MASLSEGEDVEARATSSCDNSDTAIGITLHQCSEDLHDKLNFQLLHPSLKKKGILPPCSNRLFSRFEPPQNRHTDIHNLIVFLQKYCTSAQFCELIDLIKSTTDEAGDAHEELAALLQEEFEKNLKGTDENGTSLERDGKSQLAAKATEDSPSFQAELPPMKKMKYTPTSEIKEKKLTTSFVDTSPIKQESESSSASSPTSFSAPVSLCRSYLKTRYKTSSISPESKWPPTPSKKYINLALVKSQDDNYIGHALRKNIKEVLNDRQEISIEQVLEKCGSYVVFVEGAPGIGKSTLAWELCQKWDELSCMKQYSLVILLRLRDADVQSFTKVRGIFRSYDIEEKKSLVKEVKRNNGLGILFILDGFDELPVKLQKEGFLRDLITGTVLSASTLLITSRPSATAELLTTCGSRIQKRIEILGFTQESVQDYAHSVFAYDPKELENFKACISASRNPAINSLMYIPLNAAIIVQIYKRNHSLPHTLTELHTQLCLTYISRYLQSNSLDKVEKFENLPPNHYEQFHKLTNLAYDGMVHEQVIFHSVPPDLNHFGFLDAVQALYGGGSISYNFLHSTVQEFLAAYYIANQKERGVYIFQQYGKDPKWNVVWRFVAGLTKFQYYKVHDTFKTFSVKIADEVEMSMLFIQCLYEARSMEYFRFNDLSEINLTITSSSSALDFYALGYCISIAPTDFSWNVNIRSLLRGKLGSITVSRFFSGLQERHSGFNPLNTLRIDSNRKWYPDVQLNIADMKKCCLEKLTVFHIHNFLLSDDDMVHLSELIPCMKSLVELDISTNKITRGHQNGFLKVLQKLQSSSVTSLGVAETGLSKLLSDDFYYLTLKKLLANKIQRLYISDDSECKRLLNLVSAPSSLKSLFFYGWRSSLSDIARNNNIDELYVSAFNTTFARTVKLQLLRKQGEELEKSLVEIVKHNSRLTNLTIELSSIDAPFTLTLMTAIGNNLVLQKIVLRVCGVVPLSKEMYEHCSRDRRVQLIASSCSCQF